MSALIIHGHFYQPPRENPWTGVVDPEPSAHPFHDWNERIHAECYQPNSSVRIVNASSGEVQLVNNYAHISFDFGPTLLSWLERNQTKTYARIIAADAESIVEHGGHGNAIAQAYNHAILPLCNERDRRTQVRWGLADFRYRFERAPESMWLPETACNDEVLGLLIDEGLRFVILAPQQAKRVRGRTGIPACPGQTGKSVLLDTTNLALDDGQTGKSVPLDTTNLALDDGQTGESVPLDTTSLALNNGQTGKSVPLDTTNLALDDRQTGKSVLLDTTNLALDDRQTGKSVLLDTTSLALDSGQTGKSVLPENSWQSVAEGTIDTSVAYSYFHRDGSGRSIAVFFYDRELAHAIAFEQALTSSSSLVDRFARRKAETPGLINIATDGETYGHHHKFGELCLAYALEVDAPARGFSIINYGEYLDQFPPAMEVEIDNGDEGEGSSWSCAHGVSRWIRDCGCHTGGEAGWKQSWRTPLRDALDYLRDEAAGWFEATRSELFIDPWTARDDAISLILDEGKSREQFLHAHAPCELTREDERRALLFLELQRNTLLMYTSCGWFFNEISGIEPVQILKYASRAIDLMQQLRLPSIRQRFLEALSEAKSNRPESGNGADIYRRLVDPTNPSFKPELEEFVGTLA